MWEVRPFLCSDIEYQVDPLSFFFFFFLFCLHHLLSFTCESIAWGGGGVCVCVCGGGGGE